MLVDVQRLGHNLWMRKKRISLSTAWAVLQGNIEALGELLSVFIMGSKPPGALRCFLRAGVPPLIIAGRFLEPVSLSEDVSSR
jgi:hypothetical protein